jgi:hypothetical protein
LHIDPRILGIRQICFLYPRLSALSADSAQIEPRVACSEINKKHRAFYQDADDRGAYAKALIGANATRSSLSVDKLSNTCQFWP